MLEKPTSTRRCPVSRARSAGELIHTVQAKFLRERGEPVACAEEATMREISRVWMGLRQQAAGRQWLNIEHAATSLGRLVDHTLKVLLSAAQPRVASARVGGAEVGLQRIVVSRASQAFDRGRVSVRGKSAESGAPCTLIWSNNLVASYAPARLMLRSSGPRRIWE